MIFALGVALFALGIMISIALHEAGHLVSAKAFGMKVRRYFVGFGPTLFSFRRGETEYGFKAIPAGGFCDIAGMTALDPVTPEEEPRSFLRAKTWKRVVVLAAGSAAHFLLGILLIYTLAVTSGLPNTTSSPVVGEISCATSQDPTTRQLVPCGPASATPARAAGMQPGDKVVSVAGVPTATWPEVVQVIQRSTGPTQIVVERDGEQVPLTVDVAPVQRLDQQTLQPKTVGAIGASLQLSFSYNPLAAVPATVAFTGATFGQIWDGLLKFPEKIPGLVDAIGGGQRDLESPVSVVGASVIGGELADRGIWESFILLLAVLNIFIGVFNLLPLLPLDGGHIAVNVYQRVRDGIRARLGKPQMPPVDYTRLVPITYGFILVLGVISLLTLTADIVNPIRLPE